MKLSIPIVDLCDGDVVVATQWPNGNVNVCPFGPLTVAVVTVQHPRPHHEFRVIENGKPGQLHVGAYPPGVLLHVVRDEAVPGASPKPS